jgi:hypothetical protein
MLWLDPPTSLFSLSQTSSDIRFGDRKQAVSRTDSRLLTQKRIFSLAYYFTVETNGNAVKCDQLFYRPTIYTPVCLFLHIKLQLQAPLSLLKEAYNFQYNLWENRDLTGQPAIIYIYLVWAIMHPVYFSFKAESFCNGPETEVKCKNGLRPYIIYAFYHIQTIGA